VLVFAALIMPAPMLAQQEPATAAAEIRLGQAPVAPLAPKNPPAHDLSDQITFPNFLFITNRETSRQFFNTVHAASDGVPMGWSGNYAGCVPGTNSDAYLQAVVRRENYFRAMAGVPAWITFSNEYTRKAQLSALMMGANNDIDHFPPPSWLCYTADGAEAAQKSNLALGNAGPDAMNALIRDNGNNNAAVGHRRWMLYPQTRKMGCGNVPANGPSPAISVLWVFDPHVADPRPATRESFVAWPPPGYVPYQVTYARWSFSYPGADFTGTTVSMTSNGVPLSVALAPLAAGYGENTLVWVPANLNTLNLNSFSPPATDTVYHVTLNNVRISGAPQTFNYDVRVFNPAVPGPDYFPPLISGPTQALVNVSTAFNFTAVSNAASYQFRQSRLGNSTFTDGAENGLGNFVVQAATNLYAVRDSAVKQSGGFSLHLAQPDAARQLVTLNRLFLAATNSALTFHSRLGWASSLQIARMQISLDEGNSWSDIYTQAGTGGSGEAGFTLRTVPLAAWAGQTFRLRINYDFTVGNYFPQTDPGVGWYVDNFTITNAPEVLSSVIASTATSSSFHFSPTNAGSYLLEVRPLLFVDYPVAWGPGRTVSVIPNTNVVVSIRNIANTGANTWQVNFNLLNGSPTGYELWSAMTLPSAFTKETNATIQTIVPGSQFRATITSTNARKFFQIKPL